MCACLLLVPAEATNQLKLRRQHNTAFGSSRHGLPPFSFLSIIPLVSSSEHHVPLIYYPSPCQDKVHVPLLPAKQSQRGVQTCSFDDTTFECSQEADMDEEGDAERAAQWDLAAADAAYKAQVEAALAQQRAVEEEQRLLLEQLEVSRPYAI